ncbi:phosphoribosyltransferase-like protein [Micromonospora zamorensis]|uniref:phosphoribosyltransferase-like protein n=1 Tax=Micromonospora zamorensis TaxID=709883 RepID=UPI003794B741
MVADRLSDTQEGRLWLNNFLPADQPVAARLLDSLRFVSSDEFRAGMKQLMHDVAAQAAAAGPVAFYPVRPVDKELAYSEPFPDRPYGPLDGSEHITANIISEVSKTLRRSGSVMALPQIEELREHRVRTVVLIDDNIASGSTITGYLDKWWANPSIRSWRSYKLVTFVIVTYACSPLGMRTVSRHRLADDIRSVEFGGDFSSARWTPAECNEVRDLCRRYASRYAIRKSLELGYKRSESLLVIGHTLPNNLPNILWAGTPVVQPWVGFFAEGHRRLTPGQQESLAGHRAPPDLDGIAELLRHSDIRSGRYRDSYNAQRLLLVLAALDRPPRTDDWLMTVLRLKIFDLQFMLATAQRLHLIDARRRLTDEGHAALRDGKSKIREVRSKLSGTDDAYYPSSVRGVRAI